MRTYKARPQSRRWLDADCPREVLAIFDDKGPGERYTVFYRTPIVAGDFADTVYGFRGADAHPFHPQGVGMWGEMDAWQVREYRRHNAHRKCRFSDLPPDVQQLVRQDCRPAE